MSCGDGRGAPRAGRLRTHRTAEGTKRVQVSDTGSPVREASKLLQEGQEDHAVRLLERAVADGDTEAKFQLGLYFFRKHDTTQEEYQQSYDLLCDASDEGHPDAPFFVGRWHAFFW